MLYWYYPAEVPSALLHRYRNNHSFRATIYSMMKSLKGRSSIMPRAVNTRGLIRQHHKIVMSRGWAGWLAARVAQLDERSVLRSLRALRPAPSEAHTVYIDDATRQLMLRQVPSVEDDTNREHRVTVFASNDYLGLSAHEEVRAAAADVSLAHGCGPRASSLVCGYTKAHRALETELASLKGSEEALLFPSGYAANLAVIGALASSRDCAIFSDALNHASIVDGARLASHGSGAELHIYQHNDLSHLDALLCSSSAPRKLIISDSLFSMDGDFADCRGLAALRDAHDALLCLDEAHATLVCGNRGGGVAEAQGVAGDVDVTVGTLSKAFGAHGGFVGCSVELKQLLVTQGRPGIFSTALPLPAVAAARAALRLATPERRALLSENVLTFCTQLGLQSKSPIVPIVLGSERGALEASRKLLRSGFLVPAIRPPTVPAGTARLRITLSAAHTAQEIDALAAAIRDNGLVSPTRR